MKCEVHDIKALPHAQLRAWDGLLATSAIYRNPNLSPWFARAVAPHRPTLVGILSDQGDLRAVLPFHRAANGSCEALALGVSDYHGPLFHPSCAVPYLDFFRHLEIRDFRFDHLLADMRIRHLISSWRPCPLINLAKGEAGYRWDLRDRNSTLWQEMQSQWRRLERRAGPVRFEPDLRSAEALDILVDWKRRQFIRTRTFNDFDLPWNAPFLHDLLKVEEPSCSGLLSGLFVGRTPIALHMGTVSVQVLQTCYTAYDPSYADYSPGALLLFSQVAYCLKRGITVLDLGKGTEPYKQRWANDRLWVAEGRLPA